MDYKKINNEGIYIKDSFISTDVLNQALNNTHAMLKQLNGYPIDVFKILGMRNLSSFVGELFASCLSKASNGLLKSNPHQDGYPDLLLMDQKGIDLWNSLSDMLKDKAPFSPFENGGIEIKATCGAVPSPKILLKKNKFKPEIGDQRIELLTSYDWKAHHRDTNNLIGLLWDFVDNVPTIVALFYSATLNQEHWGKIIQPTEGGGRTTSVSIMAREGVKKMYEGTVLIVDDPRYVNFVNKYNKDSIIK